MIARELHISERARRKEDGISARHAADLPAPDGDSTAAPITLPIGKDEIRRIASTGFPLWESIPTMQLRNRRITLAYADLSAQLAELIAECEQQSTWDANWCTFATWSSRTIGTCIDRRPEHAILGRLLRSMPKPLRGLVERSSENFLARDHGAIYRTLAIGNRLVFLEIATAVSHFVDCFGNGDGSSFDSYWNELENFLAGLAHLDPSWVATPAPDSTYLKVGMQAYRWAMEEPEQKAKAELVLLGNLLLGAYEQQRVDTYLTATLSFFTTTWLHRILRGPKRGYVALLLRGLEAPISTLYALYATRFFLLLELPAQVGLTLLRVGQPIPKLGGSDEELFPPQLRHIQRPELQAILTRYDLSDGSRTRTRARNWTHYDERMSYITNLFRSRQRDRNLFRDPWTPGETAHLLDGVLPANGS